MPLRMSGDDALSANKGTLSIKGVPHRRHPLPERLRVSGLGCAGPSNKGRLGLWKGADVRLRPAVPVVVLVVRRLARSWGTLRHLVDPGPFRLLVSCVVLVRRGNGEAGKRRYQDAHARRDSGGVRRRRGRRNGDALEGTKLRR